MEFNAPIVSYFLSTVLGLAIGWKRGKHLPVPKGLGGLVGLAVLMVLAPMIGTTTCLVCISNTGIIFSDLLTALLAGIVVSYLTRLVRTQPNTATAP